MKIRKLNTDHIPAAAAVAAEAFKSEKFTNFLMKVNDKSFNYIREAFALRMRWVIESGFPLWGAAEGKEVGGAAVLIPPSGSGIPFHRKVGLLAGLMRIIPGIRLMRFGNLPSLIKLARKPGNIPRKYFQLEVIGVSPRYQGRGIGKALLEKVREESVKYKKARGVYLFTAERKTRELYQRCGYKCLYTARAKNISAYHMFLPAPGVKSG